MIKQNVKFQKKVFNKIQYEKVIDTSFKELGVESIQEQLDSQPSVSDFFQLYNDLFYSINELGETNSHEFLIKKSSEYIDFEENNEIIEALQKEIAELRTELLDTQKQLISSQTGINIDDPTTNGVMTNINSNTTSNTGVGSTSNGSGGGY
tara:strand:+ start:301 stop:753 length:453 start_codon:yes stop_codon:yes gene_type:complete